MSARQLFQQFLVLISVSVIRYNVICDITAFIVSVESCGITVITCQQCILLC